MAVGQFLDYTPGPAPGSYAFQRINGSPLIASGPEAENLARALERQKGMGPQPVAQNSMDSLAGVGGYGNRADVAPPIPAVQTPAAPTPGPPPSIARPPEQPAARAPGFQPIARTPTGVIVRDPSTGQLAEMTSGSPGVSKEQLQKRAANSVAIPVSQSTAVQGGYDRNPDYEEQLANASIDQKLALQSRADAEQAGALREADVYSQQVAASAEMARRDQLAAQETEALHRRDMQQLDQSLADVKAYKVEPNRMFHGALGTARLIGSAVAAGLGALGAGLARTPNFAMDLINRGIDRDVAAQESELATKKENANNALRQWTASGASLEQAKAAVKASQLEHAKAQVAQIAAVNKSQQVQAGAQALMADLDKSLAQELERYRIDSLGKRTAEVSARMAQPQAGSAGGLRPLTLDQQKSLIGIEGEKATINKTNAQAAASGKGGAIPRGYQQSYAAADSVLKTGENLLKAYGVKPGEKPGYIEGLKAGARTTGTQAGREVDSQIAMFQAEAHKLVSGNGATESDKKEFEEQRKHWSTAQKITFIQNALEMARHKQHFIESQRGTGVNSSEQAEAEDAANAELTERGATD